MLSSYPLTFLHFFSSWGPHSLNQKDEEAKRQQLPGPSHTPLLAVFYLEVVLFPFQTCQIVPFCLLLRVLLQLLAKVGFCRLMSYIRSQQTLCCSLLCVVIKHKGQGNLQEEVFV